MIGKRQLALVEAAREKLRLSDDAFATMLKADGNVTRPEDMSMAGFDAFMDHCTVEGFQDRRRPILSADTRKGVADLFDACRMTDLNIATHLRRFGGVGDIRDLSGHGLLGLLVRMESCKAPVAEFILARRSVTPKQLGLLHVAKGETGIAEERFSGVLQGYGGVNSAADLDQRGFDLVMAFFRAMGFEGKPKPAVAEGPTFGERPGFASPAQLGLIRELWAEWSGAADEGALTAWLERSYHVSALRFLNAATASKAITALKAMKRRAAERPKVTA